MKDYINIGPVPCARSASIVLCSVMSQAKNWLFLFHKKTIEQHALKLCEDWFDKRS